MRRLAAGGVLIAVLAGAAGAWCRPDLGEPRPGSAIVVSQPSERYADPWTAYEPELWETAAY